MYHILENGEDEPASDMDEDNVEDDVDQRRELRVSYACARATFLVRDAPMELNLPSTTFNSVPTPPMPSATDEDPVHPRELARAKTQVTDMLRASLNDFLRSHSANAGRQRGLFALFAGLVFCAIGLAPILLAFKAGYGRFLAFAAVPCVWLGATTIIAGLHGVSVCPTASPSQSLTPATGLYRDLPLRRRPTAASVRARQAIRGGPSRSPRREGRWLQ